MEVILNGDFYVFNCPHCKDEIIVAKNELNCKIFRHAVFKHNYEQVNPHLPFIECQKLIAEDKVYGCCKPFEIINKNDKLFVVICDYK
jgi:hypothetical protein